MPELAMHIERWTWTNITTERDSFVAEVIASGMTPATNSTANRVETVKATFALENQLAFTRSERHGRSEGQQVFPTHLEVSFTSKNGGAWDIYHDGVAVIAYNLLKAGGLGKLADVHPVWVPDPLRALAADVGVDWVNAEYPR